MAIKNLSAIVNMKKFFILLVGIIMISSTASAANWVPIIDGEYYVDKDSIMRDSTYASNGFRTIVKEIITIGANKGDYEIWVLFKLGSVNRFV